MLTKLKSIEDVIEAYEKCGYEKTVIESPYKHVVLEKELWRNCEPIDVEIDVEFSHPTVKINFSGPGLSPDDEYIHIERTRVIDYHETPKGLDISMVHVVDKKTIYL